MAPKRNHHSNKNIYFFILTISIAITFGSTIFFDWLYWDDTTHILENPRMVPFAWANLLSYWRESFFSLYIPITYNIWTLLAGLNLATMARLAPETFHFVNVVWHTANTFLVFNISLLLFQKLDQSRTSPHKLSLFSALIFALHPIQVESVAWISSFRELLATSFFLLATLKVWRSTATPHQKIWLQASPWYFCALLSKPTAVIWPFAAILPWLLTEKKMSKRLLKPAVIMALLAMPLVLFTKSLQGDEAMNFVPSLWQRPLIALDALSFYLFQVLAPWNLSPDYGRSPEWLLSSNKVYLTWILSVAFLLFSFFRSKQNPVLGIGVAWWLVILVPVLGFVPFSYQGFSTVSDRYLYLPIVGLAWIGGLGLSRLNLKRWGRVTVPLVFVGLAGASIWQSRIWKNNRHFYESVIALNPNSHMGHNGLSKTLIQEGELERALTHCHEALRLKPGNPVSLNNCGHILLEMKRYPETVEYFAKTLSEHHPAGNNHSVFSLMHTNMGAALIYLKRFDEASKHLGDALTLNSQNAMAHHNIGAILLMQGRFEESLPHLKKSVDLAPLNELHRKNYDLAREKAASARARPTL